MTPSAVYVVDLHALLYLQEMQCGAMGKRLIFNHMTDMVIDQHLYFPTAVLNECARLATGEEVHLWTKAVAGSRQLKNPEAEFQTIVLDKCEEIADVRDVGESSQLMVAAMGIQLDTPNRVIRILTEDRLPQPNRTCLVEACPQIGLQAINVAQFIQGEGLVDLLTVN